MSIKPQRTVNPVDFQKRIQDLGINWSDDPKKNLKKLQRLTKSLETQISAKELGDLGDNIYGVNKKFQQEDIRDARKWFRDEVKRLIASPWEVDHKKMSKYTRGQQPIHLPKPTDIGKMFFYGYDPKTKADLPYYDIFPLILMVKTLKDGWHGLNLHYLPPKQRAVLITRLIDTISDTRLDNKTRLKINYQLLKATAKYRYFKPCFKRYLVNHVRSTVRPVPIRHWAKAILLPVAKFKKASQSTVWADSLRIARG